MKTLIAGWFSFSNGHATAGDLLARDLVREWLVHAGRLCDVAVAAPFTDGVDWRAVDPHDYSHVVFVCGPFEQGELETEFLARFHHCRLIGLNLSMRIPLYSWNPFDLLIERDSSARAHPDLVFGTSISKVPVVGVCLVESYEGALVESANATIQRLTELREIAVVHIDTRLDVNSVGLRTPAEIESLIARMDMVITTRLHGSVLALKNGVPVLAIDPEAGGAKIVRQMKTIGWPVVFAVDQVNDEALGDAMTYCLTDEARKAARACGESAARQVAKIGEGLVTTLMEPQELEANYKVRIATAQNQPSDNADRQGKVAQAQEQESIMRRLLLWVAKLIDSLRMLGTRPYGR